MGSDIDCADHWVNPTYFSPDYFRMGGPFGYTVPSNDFGFQLARTGTAYAGIITAMFNANGREYIQCQLLDSLKSGKKYCVGFYVCLVDSSPFAVNNIGAYLSDTAISSNLITNFPYQPQIDNDPSQNPLVVRNTWIEVSDTLLANGGERFITIGNFHNDATTDTTHDSIVTTWPLYGYYYIDDVFVINCDSTLGIIETDNDEKIDLFPNPFAEKINISIKDNELIEVNLFDVTSRRIFTQSFTNSTSINASQLSKGIYFYEVRNKNGVVKKGKVIHR